MRDEMPFSRRVVLNSTYDYGDTDNILRDLDAFLDLFELNCFKYNMLGEYMKKQGTINISNGTPLSFLEYIESARVFFGLR